MNPLANAWSVSRAAALTLLATLVFCNVSAQENDLNFEVPSTIVASGGPAVPLPKPPRPDGTRETWPKWELRKVDDNVYAFRAGLHRSMVIVTSEGVVLVDPMRIWSVDELKIQLKNLTDQPITHVVYTHNHFDHIRGAAALRDSGAKFIAHKLAAEQIAAFPHADVVMPTHVWGGAKHEFTVGGEKFELHYLGKNHGDGMTFVGMPERKIMYICDVISPGRLPPGLMPDFSPRGIEETLSQLSEMDYERIVNGHEPATVSSWDAINATLELYQDTRREVRKGMQKAGGDMAPWEMVRFVEQQPKYENWRYYKQWYLPFAGRILMEEYLHW
jgi:glyoxylase-like metal-dependent hydrolase (beta-lactamase superfamily II)